MLKLLIKFIVQHPVVLLTHAQNYADLAMVAFGRYVHVLRVRRTLYLISSVCLGLALLTGSMSALLWAAMPTLNAQTSWVLIALPVVWLVLSGVFFLFGKRQSHHHVFDGIHAQIEMDLLATVQEPAWLTLLHWWLTQSSHK